MKVDLLVSLTTRLDLGTLGLANPGDVRCECGERAEPGVFMIQHLRNDKLDRTVTHGPDPLCLACVDIADSDHALGVIVLRVTVA